MDSEGLSKRKKQPGHDKTFRKSEELFEKVARIVFFESNFEINNQPTDLLKLFKSDAHDKKYGLRPELSVICKESERKIFFEVKKQGKRGNAEERACKMHTKTFYSFIENKFSLPYHPFVTIFCEHLATEHRYITKYPYFFEPNNYFLWVDYDEKLLIKFLSKLKAKWLIQ